MALIALLASLALVLWIKKGNVCLIGVSSLANCQKKGFCYLTNTTGWLTCILHQLLLSWDVCNHFTELFSACSLFTLWPHMTPDNYTVFSIYKQFHSFTPSAKSSSILQYRLFSLIPLGFLPVCWLWLSRLGAAAVHSVHFPVSPDPSNIEYLTQYNMWLPFSLSDCLGLLD